MQPEFDIHLTLEQLNTVLEGLSEMPYRRVAELLQNIVGQAQAQQKDLAAVPTAKPTVVKG